MFRNYFKIAWRNLLRNRSFALINIAGLAIGLAVVILIGLWIWDEVSFNKSFKNYDRIVQVMHNWDNASYHKISTEPNMPVPAAVELRDKYASDFQHIALSKKSGAHILAYGDKIISNSGLFAEPELTDILSLPITNGVLHGLKDPSSIMINRSLAKVLFGDADPINKIVKIDNKKVLKVTGVFDDFPHNTDFYGTSFLIPWAYLVADQRWVKDSYNQWNNNSFLLYAELADRVTLADVASKVKDLLKGKPDRNDKPEVFLHPMTKWHLYNEFKNGQNVGGNIQFVWIFGGIGLFILLLACINFMNLSTARSQKRAREVGVRKAIGSRKEQLILQFLGESVLIAFIALLLALILAQLTLPAFNQLSDKSMRLPWNTLMFWAMIISLTLFAGLLAGCYPAFYLSSFHTVKILKGTFKAGRFAALPRKVLVVVQFTVSVSLIIATIIIFQQIQYAKNRPLGYNRDGLISIPMTTPDLYGKYDLLRSDLLNSGMVVDMAEASNSATSISAHLIGFDWAGKDPNLDPVFGVTWVTHDFGKTVDWQFIAGRDFSRNFSTDSTGIILNESAVAYMGLKHPIGETVKFGQNLHVIGVIKNVTMESPFAQPEPTAFILNYDNVSVITLRINSAMSMHKALPRVEAIFKKYNPAAPFDFSFVDEDYARKFATEDRIGALTTFFALFAIFISGLGIFGLASFTAEQRTKEIGVRKVLGATISQLWGLLSKDFLYLVMISFCISIPISWWVMRNWLLNYEYHTSVSIWAFVLTAIAAITITLGTVSFQAIKAAVANPVKSLKYE